MKKYIEDRNGLRTEYGKQFKIHIELTFTDDRKIDFIHETAIVCAVNVQSAVEARFRTETIRSISWSCYASGEIYRKYPEETVE